MTPTQSRMLILLSDGLYHSEESLHRCLWDPMSDPVAVRPHISALRKYLGNLGYSISRINGYGYQLTRLKPKSDFD